MFRNNGLGILTINLIFATLFSNFAFAQNIELNQFTLKKTIVMSNCEYSEDGYLELSGSAHAKRPLFGTSNCDVVVSRLVKSCTTEKLTVPEGTVFDSNIRYYSSDHIGELGGSTRLADGGPVYLRATCYGGGLIRSLVGEYGLGELTNEISDVVQVPNTQNENF